MLYHFLRVKKSMKPYSTLLFLKRQPACEPQEIYALLLQIQHNLAFHLLGHMTLGMKPLGTLRPQYSSTDLPLVQTWSQWAHCIRVFSRENLFWKKKLTSIVVLQLNHFFSYLEKSVIDKTIGERVWRSTVAFTTILSEKEYKGGLIGLLEGLGWEPSLDLQIKKQINMLKFLKMIHSEQP